MARVPRRGPTSEDTCARQRQMGPTPPNTTNTLSDVHALRARGRPHVTVCCAGCVLGAATMLHGIRGICVELHTHGHAHTSQTQCGLWLLGVASLWRLNGLYQCALSALSLSRVWLVLQYTRLMTRLMTDTGCGPKSSHARMQPLTRGPEDDETKTMTVARPQHVSVACHCQSGGSTI